MKPDISKIDEQMVIIEDIIISLRNHRKDGDCKGVEFNRFMMREEALTFALSVLEHTKLHGLALTEDELQLSYDSLRIKYANLAEDYAELKPSEKADVPNMSHKSESEVENV